jgi:hypothetical protein
MALRGKAPVAVEKRLKALFFGEAGAGKTTAAVQFPRPYVIDTEAGAELPQYARAITEAGGALFQSNDWDDIVKEVRALLTEPHEYRTLVIDPITTIYDDAIDHAEDVVGSEWGRHTARARRDWKRLGRLLAKLDMNVIITAHAKPQYGDGKNAKVVGMTYEGPKGLDYLFDLVCEVTKRSVGDRGGVVRKTRIEGFPEGDRFPFSYQEIARRYGAAVLERQAVPVTFASPKQLEDLRVLLDVRKDAAELEAKWLKAANAESLDELPADAAAKCIDWLKGR